jgi:hypothetical protein
VNRDKPRCVVVDVNETPVIGGASREIDHEKGGSDVPPFQHSRRRSLGHYHLRLKSLRLFTVFFPIHIVGLRIVFHFMREFAQHHIAVGTFRHLIGQ